jgi:hypothetical protein
MKQNKFFQTFIKRHYPLFVALALFYSAFELSRLNSKPIIFISKQDATWNINNKMLMNFNLGLKRLESSFLWTSTILESDIEHYKNKDLNSWMYLRFNSIAELEPNFYENYSFGSVYLSIVKDDIAGANIMFNKGLEKYPNDYKLLRDASYHFSFEAKDYKQAFYLTQRIKKLYPDKFHLMGLITKLEAEYISPEQALASLNEYQKIHPPGNFFGDHIYQNRYSLKAEIDLECLNILKKTNCDLYDLANKPYLKTKNGYIAQQPWKKYRKKAR